MESTHSRVMTPCIKQFNPEEWAVKSANLIQNRVDDILGSKGRCRVMLTGGRSAERLYSAWAKIAKFQAIRGVQFYFGDERCVSAEHVDSNFGMSMRTLFHGNDVGVKNVLHRMEADAEDLEAAALRYENALPHQIDVLILGVGEDGHVASLFPGDSALQERHRLVMPVIGPALPYARLTITPTVIQRARSIFVLASGRSKAVAISRALEGRFSSKELPLRLTLNGIWLLDFQFCEDK
jgi:6-phosphogluconolactonase